MILVIFLFCFRREMYFKSVIARGADPENVLLFAIQDILQKLTTYVTFCASPDTW